MNIVHRCVRQAATTNRRGLLLGVLGRRWTTEIPLEETRKHILDLLGDKTCVHVGDVAYNLNIPKVQLADAIKSLEGEGKVYRYARRGQWDVIVKSPDVVVSDVLKEHSPDGLLKTLHNLENELRRMRSALAAIEEKKLKCDEIAARYPNRFGNIGMAGMTSLWCLLFWMVFGESVFGCEFFAFDWNLVEPITYFLGYSVVWFGVVFYYLTGQEYTYDNVRDMMEAKKRAKLYAAESIDVEEYLKLKHGITEHELKIAEIEARFFLLVFNPGRRNLSGGP
eukprot:TRINITY_DN598_c0_g11_i1.p1 TRINITY_DN598_c0_g11~~TRINITY_DN598_c0_g11_i1.p1  ORF type:complete len:280 (+),score=21.52 TRINITY_DN598_c0_g11_i1:57-896(+)